MKEWEKDKDATDFSMNRVRQLIATQCYSELLLVTDEEEDMQGYDLRIRDDGKPLVSVRLRRANYYPKYADEFTIRLSRPTGAETEYEKIIKGNELDLFAYGFMTEDKTDLLKLTVIKVGKDIDGARDFIRNDSESQLPNPDGTRFRTYKIEKAKKRGLVRFIWEEGKITYTGSSF